MVMVMLKQKQFLPMFTIRIKFLSFQELPLLHLDKTILSLISSMTILWTHSTDGFLVASESIPKPS